MRTYLVGGAVRDALLGLSTGERDWVVVGSSPDEMLANGFWQVGASFPVFLHPETGEEYALARTEKKQGHGYHGFAVDFHPGVSLEEDLQRRDLTINAMARDTDGQLVDPYGGQADLEQRVLRHVSGAFVEDPLRVLRVARFAARFAALGFRVHPETMTLMGDITRSGELDHLAPERVWREFERAMSTPTPSVFVEVLRECGALKVLLPEVEVLFGIPQPEAHHPEIDTGTHLLMALDIAAGLHESTARVVFAVLLHDLGKGMTPKHKWPSHFGHEKAGVPLVDAVCKRLRAPNAMHDLARKVSLDHLNCHRVFEMRADTVLRMLERLDAYRQPGVIPQFIAACEADYRGRGGREDSAYPQGKYLAEAHRVSAAILARDLALEGLSGPEIGKRLQEARTEAIAQVPKTTKKSG